MANLDSSWEASVVKLAQAGNLRAITFWLNRYLVPQGLCAQVDSDSSGGLTIRVVCHRLPDGDRLVHFLRQRFLALNSEVFHHLKITAQRVGAPDILWERSVALRFSAQPQDFLQPAQPSAVVLAASTAVGQQIDYSGEQTATPIQFIPRPIPRSQSARSQSARSQPISRVRAVQTQSIPKKRLKKRLSKRQLDSSNLASSNRRLGKVQEQIQIWKEVALDRADDLKVKTVRAAYRSQHWFGQRSPEVRSMLIGGSVASIVAVGCGLQVLSQYMSLPSGELWQAAMTSPKVIQSGQVQTSLEQIPMIRQAVQNPQDKAVTLVFADNAALGRGSSVAAYQQADLLMSNLDNPLLIPPGSTSLSATSSAATNSATTIATPSGAGMANLPTILKTSATKTIAVAELPAASETVVPGSAAGQDSAAALDRAAGYLSAGAEPSAAAATVHATTLEELQTHGVDIVNLATDRLMANGVDLTQTLNVLGQKNIYAVGAGQSLQAARRPQVFEIKGQKVAVLGYSDSDFHAASDRTAGLNPGLNSQIEADIKAVRDQVDWVIVSYHWNKATQADPEDSQMALSRAAIDHGADLVVGYAPQIMQGAEIYGGRAIVYSLGNNIDAYSSDKATYNTAALKVTLQDRTMQVEYLPIQVQQNQSAIAQGDAAVKITQYLQQTSSLFDHPMRSPLTLDARLRVSLPTAPDAEMPTNPFLGAPSPVKP